MPDAGALERLAILAYANADYSGDVVGRFDAFVNPHEITLSTEIEYDSAQGSGTTNSRMNFKAVKPGDLSLSLFLDGTGANGRSADVQTLVDQFRTVTGYNGDIHRPNYLKVLWGTIPVKRCVLKSWSVAYKLFRPDGAPLRAVITATFSDNSDDTTRVAEAQDQSPDLTHRRVVRAGDRLPALCHAIYGDPQLSVHVARANGLDGLQTLAPGTVLFFPPLARSAR